MKLLMTGLAALAAITFALFAPFTMLSAPLAHATPFAQTNAGDQCWNWHATTLDTNGNPLVCVYGVDTGHLTYWQPGNVGNYPGH
jgi:hypothetical protein